MVKMKALESLILTMTLMTLINISNEAAVIHPAKDASSVIGSRVEFTCIIISASNFDNVMWTRDGEELSAGSAGQNHSDVVRMHYNQDGFGHLMISNLSISYNNSAFACAPVQGSTLMEPSSPTRLIILDNILPVGFLTLFINNSMISLTWVRPNISSAITDITYCVAVYTTESTIFSQCGITNTAITYALSPQDYTYYDDNITFSVLPTNGFINGSLVNCTHNFSNGDIIPDTEGGQTIGLTSQATVPASVPATVPVTTNCGYSFSSYSLQLLIIYSFFVLLIAHPITK